MTSSTADRRRIESVDLLRGIVMVLMALDHTRDFIGTAADPTAVGTASLALFLTRWITHLCAPTFFLLTGVGAGLARRSQSTTQLARYLVTRGALLVVLELTVFRIFAYQFNADYHVTMLIVIWALGCAMILLGGLVFLPRWAIGAFGAALILGHNAFDGVRSANPIWAVLHGPGFVATGNGWTVFAAYPLAPWVGVTAVGYVLASLYDWTPEKRRAALRWMGVAAIVAFVALRFVNAYGDPRPWASQSAEWRTVMSFFNATKYPPSLAYLLMTLGPALLLLSWLEGNVPRPLARLIAYGRAPLFYFGAHFALIHVVATLLCLVTVGSVHWMFESPTLGQYPFTRPPGWGFSLPVVYAVWLGVVVSLYPVCRWVGEAKRRSGASPIWRYF